MIAICVVSTICWSKGILVKEVGSVLKRTQILTITGSPLTFQAYFGYACLVQQLRYFIPLSKVITELCKIDYILLITYQETFHFKSYSIKLACTM